MISFRVGIIQNGVFVPLLDWIAAEGAMKKVYKPDGKPGDWSGITWHNGTATVPRDSPICGWHDELCDVHSDTNSTTIILSSVFGVILVFLIAVSIFGFRKYRYEVDLKEVISAKIYWSDLETIQTINHDNISHTSNFDSSDKDVSIVGFGGKQLAIKPLRNVMFNWYDRRMLIALKEVRDLNHENIIAFVGITSTSEQSYILVDCAPRGSVQDIIYKADIKLDKHFKMSILDDICCGLSYLNTTPVKHHGRLTSAKCVLDSRWICKITGHGLEYVKGYTGMDVHYASKKLLWTAPELLNVHNPIEKDTVLKADVYSFGIIAQEVMLLEQPYGHIREDIGDDAIIDKVKAESHPPFRPKLLGCPEEWQQLIENCWKENPDDRPNFRQILTTIFKMTKGKNMFLVDNMVHRLEVYTQRLEDRVAERSKELLEEKTKVDHILSELLPPSVAQKLALGYKVEPEAFVSCTLFFSDIVGFTSISAQSDAMQVVNMLNSMYSMFDGIAYQFDVYKVATIGDAYMVSSGVPIRNGDKHAAEICGMSLGLLDAIHEFRIPHLENEHLYMRIGIHSGPCVAGVTGLKMPRYLLFGDTVDIAAKMESGGQSMKIHISDTTERLVRGNKEFHINKRGKIEIKGMGSFTTFWLESTISELLRE